MSEEAKFAAEVAANVEGLSLDRGVQGLSNVWLREVARYKYSYNFSWLGRPIIQLPQDIVAMQEILWRVRPDLVVETGVAHGGSLILHASILELLGGDRLVVGVDVEVRPHNRSALEAHPMSHRIRLLEGSSVDPAVVEQVRRLAHGRSCVLVVLDSNHTHDHVRKELEAYSSLVTSGSYLVVFDTVIEDVPAGFFADRPWDRGNNPKTAVREFLSGTDRFVVDADINNRLLLTAAPDGYLRCVRD